jgi:hypothetical protein
LYHITLLHHFPTSCLLPLVPQAGPISQFCSLILYKKRRRKKWYFWLFKIATHGVSLLYFHVYM